MANRHKLLAAGTAIAVSEPALALMHQGGLGVIAGLALGAVAYQAAGDIAVATGKEEDSPLPTRARDPRWPSVMRRMFTGKSIREQEIAPEPLDGEPSGSLPEFFTLSDILATGFKPSLEKIFLAFLPDGLLVYAQAKGLCHVALAGSTGGGKSVLMRLLMVQLCHAGAQVLLLNPHYTCYDIQADPPEDWTPFEQYLVADPMECRRYEVIEHYLKQVATELLPKRLEKYARSQPLGKPYFLVIDELPAIVAKIKEAPEYIASILREGRKVGIFLITASQDFLVSTIAPGGGGAVRDCFRTAFYVGGDPTTARVLLDMPAKLVPENELGKGTVMLRGGQVKQASLARVPYVDNQALYQLLGPSTYQPARVPGTQAQAEDELLAYMVSGQQEGQGRAYPTPRAPATAYDRRMAREQRLRSVPVQSAPVSPAPQVEEPVAPEDRLHGDERSVLEAYRAGLKTGNAIAPETGLSSTRVNQILNKLSRMGLIDWQPRKA